MRRDGRGRCSHENMEVGSEWVPVDRNTKTEVDRYKIRYLIRLTKRISTKLENLENDNSIGRPSIKKMEKKESLPHNILICTSNVSFTVHQTMLDCDYRITSLTSFY